MSYLTQNNGPPPATPAANKSTSFADSSAQPPFSGIDQYGAIARFGNNHNPSLIRNGGFWFAQRQIPGTATTYSSVGGRAITADGWGISNENASIQYQRVDSGVSPETNLISRYYGSFTKITTLGKLLVCQVIEAADAENVRVRRVRLQMKLKSISGNATYRIGLVQSQAGVIDTVPNGAGLFVTAFNGNTVDPTLGANLAYIAPDAAVTYVAGTVVGSAISCSLSGNWTQVSGVFAVPSGARNLIAMIWSDSQVAAAAGVAIAEVSLTEGYEIQSWAPQPIAVELARVQRYYAKTFAVDTAPAQNAGVATGCLRCILGKAAATALAAQFQWRFPVNMRAAPATITTYNPAAANAQVRQIGGTASDLTATATANATEQSVDITATGVAAGTVGDQCGVHVSADAEL